MKSQRNVNVVSLKHSYMYKTQQMADMNISSLWIVTAEAICPSKNEIMAHSVVMTSRDALCSRSSPVRILRGSTLSAEGDAG